MSARRPITLSGVVRAALDDADDAGPAEAGHDLVAAEALELVRHDPRGAVNVEQKLRVFVEVAAPGGDFIGEVGDAVDDRHEVILGEEIKKPSAKQRRGAAASTVTDMAVLLEASADFLRKTALGRVVRNWPRSMATKISTRTTSAVNHQTCAVPMPRQPRVKAQAKAAMMPGSTVARWLSAPDGGLIEQDAARHGAYQPELVPDLEQERGRRGRRDQAEEAGRAGRSPARARSRGAAAR